MKRAVEVVLAAAVAVAFVVCVEFVLMMWRRRRRHVENVAVVAPAQLRVRRATDGVRATFAVDGVLDAFSARLLAYALVQTPPAATVVLDLSVAGPIQENLADILANACASRRRVQLRGLNEGHAGLLERLRGRGVATAVIEEERYDAREAA